MRRLTTCLLVLSACVTASADVRVPRLFSDNMILQQQTSNVVWGFATPGEMVTVRASWGAEETAVADEGGAWKVMLKTPSHGTGYSLIVSGKNTITIQNVAVGEVLVVCGSIQHGMVAWEHLWRQRGSSFCKRSDLPHLQVGQRALA